MTQINKILIIDDEQTCIDVVSFALECHGFEVVSVECGQDAISLLKTRESDNIDLILLDMMLPDIHGLDLLEEIRKIDNIKKTPVIIQTGSANIEAFDEAVKLGKANMIIMKPFNRADLISSINKIINSKCITNS